MYPSSEFDPVAFTDHLAGHGRKTLLRFLASGSVDDGKSTLIGRLVHDTKLLSEDQLAGAEREQGIAGDVAYRFFATDKRKFIIADASGHEQYTRNMAAGASNADLAVILVDAHKGILTQTRRYSFIASLLGIRHIVIAVNKIDLIGYSRDVFDKIVADYLALAYDLGFETVQPIPLSARFGDNVMNRSHRLAWYEGPTLVEHLETVEISERLTGAPFRMPVQWVNRPNLDFRGFSGTVASGRVKPGDPVVVAGSGRASTVKSIVTYDGDLPQAVAGEAVTITLTDELDVARGDMLSSAEQRPEVSDQFAAHMIWMHEEALYPGRRYLLKIGARQVMATVTKIRHKVDVNSFQHLAARQLGLNEVAVVNLSLQEPVAFDPYAGNRATGGFVLIDRLSNLTVGAGMIDFGLRRATNIHRQPVDIDKTARAAAKGQKPAVLWFTGLSGAGKSSVANLVEKKLFASGCHTYLMDGDNVRHGLNRDLSFTEVDRVENIRRVAETVRLMVDAGLIVLASFISPFRSERRLARDLMEVGEFIEIFVDAPLHVAEKRDPKGLYKRARAGQIKNFTGIDSPYERPEEPELHLNAELSELDAMAEAVVSYLRKNQYLPT